MTSYRISLDTNVLLELYRFTPKAREELLAVLSILRHRLWIPHQVAKEYYGRRISAVKEHLALYESVPEALEEQKKKAIQELHTFVKRCSIGNTEKQKLISPIEQAFQRVTSEIGKHRDAFDLSLERVIDSDPVLIALGDIFDERTGKGFSDEEATKHTAESQRRAAEKIPPGYRDAGKAENAHGDFFVWEQLLVESAKDSKPLLFVTNDAKDDWVRKEAGLIVGARPELVAEFEERCKSDFLIMQLGRFLQIAKEVLGVSISESTVAQAENFVRRGASQRPPEVFLLPKAHFHDFLDALHLESRSNPEAMKHLSANSRRRARQRAQTAGMIMDNIKYSATRNGDEVEFQLNQAEWEIAQGIWQRHTNRDLSVTEPKTLDPSVMHFLEERILQLEGELSALGNNVDSESEAAVEIRRTRALMDSLRRDMESRTADHNSDSLDG
ncbi:PIN-like domain-containing protein [Streptomyces sp. NBC_00063]|uniref:PIN-like domain-containing protein n=1 Tax=Streptomyces sp. NBC_00063 TaxID=2975638 RepID=UPI003D7226E2